MKKYTIKPLGLLLKDNQVHPHGTVVTADQLTRPVEELLTEGYIEEVEGSEEVIQKEDVPLEEVPATDIEETPAPFLEETPAPVVEETPAAIVEEVPAGDAPVVTAEETTTESTGPDPEDIIKGGKKAK